MRYLTKERCFVNTNTKIEERQELVDIYNNLPTPLKKELLTIARIIDTTQEITLREGGKKEINSIS